LVIREQLALVFPDLPEIERTAIHKRFIKNFCDVLVEVLKSVSIKAAEMSARMRIVNFDGASLFGRRAVGHVRHLASVQLGVAAARGRAAARVSPWMRPISRCTMPGRSA
jgi:lauroyl/myristoyl acyltransferase